MGLDYWAVKWVWTTGLGLDCIVLVVVAAGLDCIFRGIAAGLDWVVVVASLDCIFRVAAVGLDWVGIVVGLDYWAVEYRLCELEHLGVVLIAESNPFGHQCGTPI